MAIDKEKYINKYVEEGFENLNLIETLIFDIKDGISVEDDLATLLRSLHTLKGTSRMLEFKQIEELSHCLESVFVGFREQRIGLSENAVKLVLATLDMLKHGFNSIKQDKHDNIDINDYVKNLSCLAANEDFVVPKNDNEQENKVITSVENQANISKDKSIDVPVAVNNFAANTETKVKTKKDSKTDSIRLSLEKIDGIIKSIASLQSLEISVKSISQESASLSSLIKIFSLALKETFQLDLNFSSNLRKIERLAERLSSSLKNYSIDTGNSIRNAYDSVISLRTLPLSTILDSFPRFVYELSRESGKKVSFTIEGKENEIDKNIIESLQEVIMHMVRNAIDHGLETPQERASAEKEETGRLAIVCSRESGSMKIVITDNGRGIDYEKIRQKAVRDGFVAEAAASNLTKEDLTNFIFQSGFSTSGSISSISGRGVGMDVVRKTVESLKGSIVVESVMGKGTTFTIVVPLSIAAITGFPIECGELKFIIPSGFVESILLINKEDIITVVDHPEIKYNNRIVKLYFLNHILKIKADTVQMPDAIFTVIIRSYDDIAAIAVDNIDSMRSIILKTMPSFMESISLLSGIVLNEDYEMVSVLHIPTVLKMAKRIKTIDIKKRNIETENIRKYILVVDDSKPTREIESDILSSEGYFVDTAEDGAQALKAVKSKHYDLVCTDLNMPVMDGFMLIENIRKNEELSQLPIIVISSKADEEDQKRAYQLGASHYIIKNSFNNHNLLEAVSDLIGRKQ